MVEDTPVYVNRPECIECFARKLGELTGVIEANGAKTIALKDEMIVMLSQELQRLHARHSALLLKTMELYRQREVSDASK